MALKAVTYQFKGMNRDLSNINANEQFAYEIRNMKITPDNDNTLLSISNIKGHKDTNIKLTGTPIGHAVIDNQWIIFCAGTSGVSKTGVISEDTSIEDTGNLNPPQSTIPEIDVGNRDYIYMLTKEEDSF